MKTPWIQGTVDDGYFSETEGQIWNVPTQGTTGLCIIGQYCQGGVSNDCGDGKYCHEQKMVADGPDCDKGYYCVGGALNRRPSDLLTHNG